VVSLIGLPRPRLSSSAAGELDTRIVRALGGRTDGDFWNFAHEIPEARIRVVLERLVFNSAWFFRPGENRGVTMNVIFGTWNRVSQTCSNNPILATANMTQLAHTMRFGAQNEVLPKYLWDSRTGGRRCVKRAGNHCRRLARRKPCLPRLGVGGCKPLASNRLRRKFAGRAIATRASVG